ncbi:MAG: hypothetical protein WC292_06730 [Clostridia bacterium]
MKKTLTAALVVVVIISAVFALSACENEDGEVRIEKLEASVAKNTVYKIGTTFEKSTIAITAVLTDGTKQTVTSPDAIDFDTSGLELKAGKFTKEGTFILVIKYLRLEPVEVEINVVK